MKCNVHEHVMIIWFQSCFRTEISSYSRRHVVVDKVGKEIALASRFACLLVLTFSIFSLHFDSKINKACVRQLKSRLWAQSIAPRTMIPYRFRSNQTSIGSKWGNFFPTYNECWKVFTSYFSSSTVRWEIEMLFFLAWSHREQGNCKTDNVQIYCHNLKGEEEEESGWNGNGKITLLLQLLITIHFRKKTFSSTFLHFFFFQIEFSPFQWVPNKLQFHLTLSLWAPMALADNILHSARRNPTQLGHQEHLLFFWALNTPSKLYCFSTKLQCYLTT